MGARRRSGTGGGAARAGRDETVMPLFGKLRPEQSGCRAGARATRARKFRSVSCSRIAGFSSVEVSCVIASPFASERSRRRMILPERVFGRLSPKRMSFGLAIGPISLPTQSRSAASAAASSPVGRERLSTTNAQIASPVVSSAADHGGFGHQLVRHQRRLDLHRAQRWPDTFSTSSMRPMIVK
jgi:hypothetical protein